MLHKTLRALTFCLLCVNPFAAQSDEPSNNAASGSDSSTSEAAPSQTGELVWRDPSCFFFVLKIDEKYALSNSWAGRVPW